MADAPYTRTLLELLLMRSKKQTFFPVADLDIDVGARRSPPSIRAKIPMPRYLIVTKTKAAWRRHGMGGHRQPLARNHVTGRPALNQQRRLYRQRASKVGMRHPALFLLELSRGRLPRKVMPEGHALCPFSQENSIHRFIRQPA